MSDSFDPQEMIERFKKRAEAIKDRNLPPIAGDERAKFIKQAEADYMDYSIIADADASLDDGVLTLTVNLKAQ